jgi:ATP-dependent Clp protease adapter protein ClpS
VRLFRVGDTDFFIQRSVLVVVLVISFLAIVGVGSAPAIGLAYIGLLILHESGHVVAARCFGLKVHSVTVSAISGLCRFDFPKSYSAAFLVVSAGLLAQLLLLIASLGYVSWLGEPKSDLGGTILMVFIYVNALLILFNVFPEKRRESPVGTDGYLLWQLLARRLKRQPFAYPDTSVTLSPDTRLLRLKRFRQEGFAAGIEVLNDNATPMEFVVGVLSRNLGISQAEAVKLMLSAHASGGLVIAMDRARAEAVSGAIAQEASAAGYPLVCRVALPEPPESWIDEPRFRPPWSGQTAGIVTRLLGAVFLLVAVLTGALVSFGILRSPGFLLTHWALSLGLLLPVYMTALFARVVFTGRAPKGWLPWS